MEKKRELNREEMEQVSSGEFQFDGFDAIAGSGERMTALQNPVRSSNCLPTAALKYFVHDPATQTTTLVPSRRSDQ